MLPRKKKNSYQTTEILTADPGRLVLLLYDGAISYLKLGKEKLKEEDYKEKGRLLMKAHAVVAELLNCLDYENGGEIADRLHSIYTYILKQITCADIQKDVRLIDETLSLLSELRESWQTIVIKNRTEKAIHPQENRPEVTATI